MTTQVAPPADHLQLFCPACRAVCHVRVEEADRPAECWQCGTGFDPMAADETPEDTLVSQPGG